MIVTHPVNLQHTDGVSLGLKLGRDGVEGLDGGPEGLYGDRLEHIVLGQYVDAVGENIVIKSKNIISAHPNPPSPSRLISEPQRILSTKPNLKISFPS